MSKQQARELIKQAEKSIKAENPQVALEELRQSILYNPKDPDAYLLLGIALAQTDNPLDAENALRKATQLAPNSAKAHYNLAVQLYAQGQRRKALAEVQRSLELEPERKSSAELAARIREEDGIDIVDPEPPTPTAITETSAPSETDAIPFIARFGPAWTWFAWFLAGVSLVGAILYGYVFSQTIDSMGGVANMKDILAASQKIADAAQRHPLYPVAFSIGAVSNLGTIIFVMFDVVSRRRNIMWILPAGFCTCTGFAWIILPIYLLFGRNK